ncbi:alpha/beta hydrolase family protein [Paenibacillus koleovorans]|uniref:alpha/beta hydrolase family protein n=1 Tax=Paenibacillus koleovorans TaxID=121608 RepID=UPI000FD8F141|nr:prolyl oligopeptidase family serine peptidase [Paenibacillus koleovorans]
MNVRELERYSIHLHQVKDQWKRIVYEQSEESFRRGKTEREHIRTVEHVRQRQQFIRSAFLSCIGGLPEHDPGVPQQSRITGVVQLEEFRIEKVVFSSREGVWVTANLYVPNDRQGPGAAVLFLCGHYDRAKHTPEYQMVCQYLVQAGLVVLAIDPPGQGERLQYVDQAGAPRSGIGVSEHDYAGAPCLPLGDSLARYFLHDAMRAVDYLISRPEVDPSRIGVTGNSGGGLQTSMMMMADPRIAAAAPGTFIMSRQSYMYADQAQDAEQIWPSFSAKGLDHEDILLAMAPKPVLVLACAYDFFPIEGTKETVDSARNYWRLMGEESRLGLLIDDSPHRYTPLLARGAAAFLTEHLNGAMPARYEPAAAAVEPSQLWCTEAGQVLIDSTLPQPQLALHDEIAHRAGQLQAAREAIPERERRESALSWLKDTIYANRQPVPFHPRLHMLREHVHELDVDNAIWWSQHRLMNHGMLFREHRFRDAIIPITLAVWEGGTGSLQRHWEWILAECRSGRSVMVVDVTGSGALLPETNAKPDPLALFGMAHKLADDMIWLGDSVVAMRAYDVIRAARLAAELPLTDGRDITVYACGRQGIYAELAAAVEDAFPPLRSEQPLASLTEWVQTKYYDPRDSRSILLPGMLQYFDLPDLRRWRDGE